MTQSTNGTVVGFLRVAEGVEVTKTYETASWYTSILLTPGLHPVKASLSAGKRTLQFAVPGTIIEEYTPSSFGGVIFGDGTRTEKAGKATEYRFSWGYHGNYQDPHNMSPGMELQLFPGVITAMETGSKYDSGEPIRRFVVDEDIIKAIAEGRYGDSGWMDYLGDCLWGISLSDGRSAYVEGPDSQSALGELLAGNFKDPSGFSPMYKPHHTI